MSQKNSAGEKVRRLMPQRRRMPGGVETEGADSSGSETATGHKNSSPRESIEQLKSVLGGLSDATTGQSGSILSNANFRQWIREFDSKIISDAMLYSDNGRENFNIFGNMASPTTVDFQQHQILFFLVNDILGLQLLLLQDKARIELDDYRESLALNIAVNAAYLCEYLCALLGHLDNNIFRRLSGNDKGAAEIANGISRTGSERYLSKLKHLAGLKSAYQASLVSKTEKKQLPNLPVFPVVIGHLKNEEAVLMNIYLSKEMAEQMRRWLAQLQAEGIRSR